MQMRSLEGGKGKGKHYTWIIASKINNSTGRKIRKYSFSQALPLITKKKIIFLKRWTGLEDQFRENRKSLKYTLIGFGDRDV